MYRSPLNKQTKQPASSASMDRQPNRVPTAPLKSRPKGQVLTVNEMSNIGKERLSALVDKMKQQSFTNKEKSKVEIVTLPKAQSRFRETVTGDMNMGKAYEDMKRPQTSKCSRRKDREYDSQYHQQDHEDLIIIGGMKGEMPEEVRKKPATRVIHSAQPKKSRMKPIDDLIKYNNGSCVKKHGMQSNTAHFQTSLGAQFLGLFANN